MKRLPYIYLSAPLALVLGSVPSLLSGVWAMSAALLLAVGLWSVVWLRLYANRRLRPEFAVLTVLPQIAHRALLFAGDAAAPFRTIAWQNMYFFAWAAAAFVAYRALLCGPQDDKPKKPDAALIFMSIITFFFCLSSWVSTASAFSEP